MKFTRSYQFNFIAIVIAHFLLSCSLIRKDKVDDQLNDKSKSDFFLFNKYTHVHFPIQEGYNFERISEEFTLISNLNTEKNNHNDVFFRIDSLLPIKKKSYFRISIFSDSIIITANHFEGMNHAAIYLLEKIKQYSYRLPLFYYEDYALIDERALHFVIRNNSSLDTYKNWIDLAWRSHFNTLIVQLTNSIEFKSLKYRHPTKEKLSLDSLKEIIKYAESYGLRVIPEIKLLTKQKKTFNFSDSSFLINEQTYNPENPNVYEVVFSFIDEVLSISDFNCIHIGHDEVYGTNNRNRTSEPVGADLFLYDVDKIHKYLNGKDVKTMMWADMLWDREKYSNIRGGRFNIEGYNKIIDLLPKDIILCDWHYKSTSDKFPTYEMFNSKGFETWGATWDDTIVTKNFTYYVSNLKSNKNKGMIATTWNKTHSEIESIIINSGNKFWNE